MQSLFESAQREPAVQTHYELSNGTNAVLFLPLYYVLGPRLRVSTWAKLCCDAAVRQDVPAVSDLRLLLQQAAAATNA